MTDNESDSLSAICLLAPDSASQDGRYNLLLATTDTPPGLKSISIDEPTASQLNLIISSSNLPKHLQLPASQIHIIVSTHSGAKSAPLYHQNILKPLFSALSVKYTLHTTSSKTAIAELSKNLTSNPTITQTIVLLSGDTGINELLNAINPAAVKNTTLCVLPFGTANALAMAHNLTIQTLLFGKPRRLPTFTATFSSGAKEHGQVLNTEPEEVSQIRGCVIASYGFHATIVGGSDSEEYRTHGMQRFAIVAGEILSGTFGNGPGNGFQPYTSKIGGLSSATDMKHSVIMMCLVDRLEPTFEISPKSVDGEVWTMYVAEKPAEEFSSVLQGAYSKGIHIESEIVGYEKVDTWKITDMEDDAGWKRWVCVDGRFVEVAKGGRVNVELDQGEEGGLWVLK